MDHSSKDKKDLLLKLIQWKAKLIDDSSEKIAESLLLEFILCFVQNFSSTDDSPERRELICIAEKIAAKIWQDCNFRVVKENVFFVKIIDSFETVEKVEFLREEIWFGGVLSSLPSTSNESFVGINAARFFSLLLVLLAEISQLISEKLFSWMEDVYEEPEGFLEAIIEHDDRCLTILLALLQLMKKKLEIPVKFHPINLFLRLFKKIDFDPQTILDWLYSEIVAIPFLLRFLKEIDSNFEEFSNKCAHLDNITAKRIRCSNAKKYTVENLPVVKSPDDLVFTVEELHGEKVVEREVRISTKRHVKLVEEEFQDVSNCQEPLLESFSEFVIRLRLKLERLEETGLAPFNIQPVVTLLEKLEEKLEESSRNATV
uniref:Uncharacterized protein n=1 Tax=Acrobeloides nanus TaxID=290746 RepID=A0A914E0G8_9BILA